jgi:tetratricopeptide (TPR) repeat protein
VSFRLRSIFPLALVLVSTIVHAQSPTLFRFDQKPGPYAVGLKVVQQYDDSRTYRSAIDDLGKPYVGKRARPLQTLIWYPALKSSASTMTVRDYAELTASELNFDNPKKSEHAENWTKAMAPALASPLWSVRDAAPSPGRFPVVIYAPSFSSWSWENADLCEYLATNGYLVVASPDMGAASREMTNDIPGINAQARDISFLIGYAQTLANADTSEIAVAGFSWGGISNLFAAARDNRIRALVALDGSMRYYPGLVKHAGDVHPELMTIPLLFFTQGEFTFEDEARYLNDPDKNSGPNVLNSWTHGGLLTVDMLGMAHVEFSSMYQRNEDVWKNFPDFRKADYTREDGIPGYAWVARYTLAFLDAQLKHDAAALAWLKKAPAENGVPLHLLSATFRPAKGIPATMEAFRAELGRQGFDHAADVYAAIQKDDPSFKIDESAFYPWASDLTDDNHIAEATELLKLNVKLHPDSSDAYAWLGGSYNKLGQKQLAIENYRNSLERNPDNEESKKRLKELESSAPAKQ